MGEAETMDMQNLSNDAETLKSMAVVATKRYLANLYLSARRGDKEFQMEQTAEFEKKFSEATVDLSAEEKISFKKSVLEIVKETDYEASEAEAIGFVNELTQRQGTSITTYKHAKRLEYAVNDDDVEIIPKSRKEYVFWFKAQQRKSARATLEMCRTTYEAFKSLRESDFASFCADVGYKDDSSTIRKFLAIGKVYPRLIDYADKLPVAWTSIYLLTQIPADDFERCVKEGFAFDRLTGSELKLLAEKTRDANNLTSPFKQDKKQLAYPVAKVFLTKLPDDMDFRLLQKALEEVQARLPVKFQFIGEQMKVFKERSVQRYEAAKREVEVSAAKPSEWDFGKAANEVHKINVKAA